MKCGSIYPVTMRNSASAKRLQTLTGGSSLTVRSVAGSSARWSMTSRREGISEPRMISRSAGVLGRCMPVPMMMTICESATPAALRTFSMAGRNCLFGTGRVMSETVMATLLGRRALRSSASGSAPIGLDSASSTARSGRATAGTGRPSRTAAELGTRSAIPSLP